MTCHVLTHEISERIHRYLPVCRQSTPGTGYKCLFTATTDGTLAKNFCQSVQKRYRKKERRKETQLQSFLRYTQTQQK